MSQCRPLVLKSAYISYELDQFIRVESFDAHVPYNDVIVNYLMSGIEKGKVLKIPKRLDISKTVYIPGIADDLLRKEAIENKIKKNNLFMNYLMRGIEENKNLSSLQQNWFNLLKKTI